MSKVLYTTIFAVFFSLVNLIGIDAVPTMSNEAYASADAGENFNMAGDDKIIKKDNGDKYKLHPINGGKKVQVKKKKKGSRRWVLQKTFDTMKEAEEYVNGL